MFTPIDHVRTDASQLPSCERSFTSLYEKACHDFEIICHSEKDRQWRLNTLLLEEENEELRATLEEDDERIEQLENSMTDLRNDLEVALTSSEDLERDLRTRTREIENMKVLLASIILRYPILTHKKTELSSLNGVTTDSNKVLTEKLALARELSSLRPELEHLRSLSSSHQSLLADKLSLQRQVNTLQVEIENERRTAQRLTSKDGRSRADVANVEASLEAAQADLAKERRERQKSDRDHQKSTTELENRITTLESRLDSFRTKLKSTKESLKEAQAEVQKAQAVKKNQTTEKAANPGKRKLSELHADTLIGTPGDLPVAKRGRLNPTMPGEKSTFSITPFLNRTISIPPESPGQNVSGSDGEDVDDANGAGSPSKSNKLKIPISKDGRKFTGKPNAKSCKQKKPDHHASESEMGHPKKAASRPPNRKAVAAPKLAQVDEEEAEPAPAQAPPQSKTSPAAKITKQKNDDEGPKVERKKRKLLGGGLGKTLFDEEEGDGTVADRKPANTGKGLGALGRRGLHGPEFGQKTTTGFGAISPLKKERMTAVA